MKAIVYTKYGSPSVLQFKEAEKPAPKDGEILVKVYAASANPLDWHFMRGAPFLARLSGGLRKPKDPRLGADFAGRVEAVGNNVTQFQPGDEVFGASTGTFAGYACATENEVALKPANLSFEEAAAIPVAAITALQGLRDKGQIQPGQKVLVNGASGGVGSFGVQIARSFGAEVTGVCSTRNVEMVHSIGADHVIDYTQEDFTRNGRHYDLIYDAVGNRSVSDYRRALNPNGICAIAGFQSLPRLFEHMVLGPLRSKIGNKKVGLMGIAQINQKDLVFVKELVEAGKVVPVIDRRYSLCETAEAIRYLEEGHARGKVVITVEQNTKSE
ncbi:MAG TPA: NAD(P)-dependent alcohol dehydrogenase [Ktedonobacteraceae bacterium]|nr:NAD(P)-dependent alcohol dehydrogenase [Ktedonobacteraceae bacterium]